MQLGKHDDLLTIAKKRKVRWYGHISSADNHSVGDSKRK